LTDLFDPLAATAQLPTLLLPLIPIKKHVAMVDLWSMVEETRPHVVTRSLTIPQPTPAVLEQSVILRTCPNPLAVVQGLMTKPLTSAVEPPFTGTVTGQIRNPSVVVMMLTLATMTTTLVVPTRTCTRRTKAPAVVPMCTTVPTRDVAMESRPPEVVTNAVELNSTNLPLTLVAPPALEIRESERETLAALPRLITSPKRFVVPRPSTICPAVQVLGDAVVLNTSTRVRSCAVLPK